MRTEDGLEEKSVGVGWSVPAAEREEERMVAKGTVPESVLKKRKRNEELQVKRAAAATAAKKVSGRSSPVLCLS